MNKTRWSPGSGKDRLEIAQSRITEDAALVHAFTQVFAPVETSVSESLLAGALVSVKDLFDVKGYVTRAGTTFMQGDDAASADASVIHKLRQAGGLMVGHTNMTELAYSGLGLNPHYGTPANALIPDCIPGGSTAGGAVSVATGVSDIAIGTDTGGSLRIPAAFNGITGFKPSQSRVSQKGCKTLSYSLDSVGPMAVDVTACKLAFDVMRSSTAGQQATANPVFVIPSNFGIDDLDDTVAKGFEQAVQLLSRKGFRIATRHFNVLDSLKSLAIWQFAAVEGRAAYDDAYVASQNSFDPRIASRLARADEVNAVSYRKTLNHRIQLTRQFADDLHDAVLLMPTAPIRPPTFSQVADDDDYTRINLQVLRNPSIANVMDGCSISLPFQYDDMPIGIMLTAPNNHDDWLLAQALDCERALSS